MLGRKRKRTDSELMDPIPGPESQLQEVQDLCGSKASASLEKILTEFDVLFMKHKADVANVDVGLSPNTPLR